MPYFITRDQCQIYYTLHGFNNPHKPFLIFINGTAQTNMNWFPHLAVFKKNFQIITYDLRSQGKSDLGNLELSYKCHVKDLLELLNFLNIGKIYMVGMSHGAYIGLVFASIYPEKVEKIALASTGTRQTYQTITILKSWEAILELGGIEAMAWAFIPVVFGEQFLKANQDILDKIAATIVKRNRQESMLAHLKAMRQYPQLSDFTENIKAQNLIFSGDEDILVPCKNAQELAKLCKGKYIKIKGTGHSLATEAPKIFTSKIINFFTS